MKKNIIFLILVIINLNSLFSQNTSFNFFVGASFPNKEVSEYFPNRVIETTDSNNKKLIADYDNVELGYNLSIKGNIELSESAYFFGSIGIHKFKVNDVQLMNYNETESTGSMSVYTSLYPISAGMNYYLYDDNFSVYLIGGLDYNYQVNTLDKIDSKYILKLSRETSFSSLGFSTGVGTEIHFAKASWALELNYSVLNFVGKEAIEKEKSIINIRTGFKF